MTSHADNHNRGEQPERRKQESPFKSAWVKMKAKLGAGGDRPADATSAEPSAERLEERVDPLADVGADETRTDVHDVGRNLEGQRHSPLDNVGEVPVIAEDERPTGSVAAAPHETTERGASQPGRGPEAGEPHERDAADALGTAAVDEAPTVDTATGAGGTALDTPAPVDEAPTLDEPSTVDERRTADPPSDVDEPFGVDEPIAVDDASRSAEAGAASAEPREDDEAVADEPARAGARPAVEESPSAADARTVEEAPTAESKSSAETASGDESKSPAGTSSSSERDYDEMTVEQLRELATERDITGRWDMTKDELIAALAHGDAGDDRYDELTVEELRELATERDITGRWDMTKDELIAALRQTSA